jgi:hypothetical protein
MKIAAFPSSGRELNKVLTYFLMVVLALTLRRGLITLSILSGLRFTLTATISRRLSSFKKDVFNLPSYHNKKIDSVPAFTEI